MKYHILYASDAVTAAWIEVWDRPKLLARQPIEIRDAGTMDWNDRSERTPEQLRIALLDPDAPKGICIDNCAPEELKAVYPSSEVIVGVGPNGNQPTPEVLTHAFRVVAGTKGQEITLSGTYFTPESRLVIAEMTTQDRWNLQFVPVEYVDMHHLKGWIPADLLASERILPLAVWLSPEETDTAGSTLDDAHTSHPFSYSASVIVVCKQSPQLDRIEPSDVAADAADKRAALRSPVDETELTDEEIEQRHSIVVRLLGSGFTTKSRVVLGYDPLDGNKMKSDFVSPQELRVRLRASLLKGNVGSPLHFWVINDKEGCGISESRTVHVLPTTEIPVPTNPGWITITQPYPVPLMTQDGPNGLELIISGDDFRPNDTVVAAVRGYGAGGYQKLQTTFVSGEELRAWLPHEMWCTHRLSFRLVIRTAAGERAIEVGEPK